MIRFLYGSGTMIRRLSPRLEIGVTRKPTGDPASVPINSSTCGQIAACLLAAPDRSRSLPAIRIRMPWPGIRWCDSCHPALGPPRPANEIFQSAEWFRRAEASREFSAFRPVTERCQALRSGRSSRRLHSTQPRTWQARFVDFRTVAVCALSRGPRSRSVSRNLR